MNESEELFDENIRLELIKKEAKKDFPIPSDTNNKIDPWSVYEEIEEIGSGPYAFGLKSIFIKTA